MSVKYDEVKIVIGAGEYNNNPGWIHTNEREIDLLVENTWSVKYKPNSIKAVLAEHVWEHLTYEEGMEAAKRCYRYLKPEGYVRCAVPDGYFPDETYQNMVQIGGPGPADHPAFSHKIVYNYNTLTRLFEEVGFEVNLLEYCDGDGQFHYVDWKGEDGVIFRSKKVDPRNQGDRVKVPSLILDAVKR